MWRESLKTPPWTDVSECTMVKAKSWQITDRSMVVKHRGQNLCDAVIGKLNYVIRAGWAQNKIRIYTIESSQQLFQSEKMSKNAANAGISSLPIMVRRTSDQNCSKECFRNKCEGHVWGLTANLDSLSLASVWSQGSNGICWSDDMDSKMEVS